MSIEIKSRRTGYVIKTVEADTLQDANLTGADLTGASLRGASLWGADLRGANLTDADLWGADLQDANLTGADLTDANLRGASLWGADLRGADLWGADLRGASLWDANLRGANLTDADLWGADLQGASLTGADLRGAKRHMDGDTAITLVGQRPILQLGPLGSRNGYMMALRTSAGLRIECGCFCGTDKEFSAAVKKTHAENPRHLKEYLAALAMIRAWYRAECEAAEAAKAVAK